MTLPAFDPMLRERLQRAVVRVAPPWLAQHCEDLVQMAAVRLLRSPIEPPFGDPLLRRVAYSVVIDEIRRRKRRSEVGMSPSMPDRIANSGDVSPEIRTQGAQLGLLLVTCLQQLAPDRRRAVTLWLQEHKVPDIAEMLGWDRKKTANLLYRGLSDLRTELQARGFPP